MPAVKAQSAVRATERVVAREDRPPVRRASKPRLLDLHRTAGNAAVADLLRGADPPAQAVLLRPRLLDLHKTAGNAAVAELLRGADAPARAEPTGLGPFELGDATAETFGENAREVPIEAESAVPRRAEGVTVDGRVHLGPGRFDATSHEGQVRIGHEVAHALQQARGVNTTSGQLPVTRTRRATLEAEAERAGHAFAGGQPFAVSGVAPPTTALFRGAEEQEPEAERELDAAIARLDAKWAADGATLAAARKQRQDWLRAHAEWHEFEVPVDEGLRKTPASLQPHELDIRLLKTALGSISREDAEYVLRRLGWTSRSVEQASVQEQIGNRTKISYRTRDISLAAEYYNQLIEDRRRRWAYVDELLHTGPDMALEMFKDTGRGMYNGALGFVQGVADLPLAPLNLVRTIQGKDLAHTIDLGDLRAGYHTSYGVHQGSSIELGTQLGLTAADRQAPDRVGGGRRRGRRTDIAHGRPVVGVVEDERPRRGGNRRGPGGTGDPGHRARLRRREREAATVDRGRHNPAPRRNRLRRARRLPRDRRPRGPAEHHGRRRAACGVPGGPHRPSDRVYDPRAVAG